MKLTITLLVINASFLLAQPELDIKPNRIEFEDLFNRFDFAFLINKGDVTLTIDSLAYKDSIYIIDFSNNMQVPFAILPDDSVRMNVMLSGFYNITIGDSLDTIYVYNNGIKSPEPLRVRIRFFEDEYGDFNGFVKDSLSPVNEATVYFIYSGVYILDTARTDPNGYYQKTLPVGEYTIGVEKENYYTVFHDSTYDPFFAELVNLDSGEVKTISFSLKKIDNPALSVSGQIIDSTSGILINKGIIIVRTGTHVPLPLAKGNFIPGDTLNAFGAFIKSDGSYMVNTQFENYYFLQAYTNNFLPGYYNDKGIASVFWQNADSVLIDGSITDKNISLIRDSSYGAGSIGGQITFSFLSPQQNYEGITILARNISNNALYSYNFGKETGGYKVSHIPYGTYELVAQKIGLGNAVSQIVTIDPVNNQYQGINLNFLINDVINENILPAGIILYQNYPNPFNPVTNIQFYLPEQMKVKLSIHNVLGETVKILINSELSSGNYSVQFDGSGLASGIYFLILESRQRLLSRKIVLLK
jgi:hypothetical protein